MGEKENLPTPGDTIYDLIDAVDEGPRPGERIYDLIDVVAAGPLTSFPDPDHYRDEILQRATEAVEKIAREIIPDIAERVIREEIEKLKAGYPDEK